MVMWNWRGRQTIAAIDRKVMVRNRAERRPRETEVRLFQPAASRPRRLRDGAAAEREDRKESDGEKGEELDAGFEGDGRDHALVMLVGVDVAGAEQDGEDRHADRSQEGGIGEDSRGRAGAMRWPRSAKLL